MANNHIVSSGYFVSGSGANIVIYSGASSSGVTLAAGDTITVANGGTATNYTMTTNSLIVSSGGLASGVIDSAGSQTAKLTVLRGGSASQDIVASGAQLVVSSGGSASNTIVSSGGVQIISTYGADSGSTILSGGFEDIIGIYPGSGTTSAPGSEGVVNNLTVNSGGKVEFGSLSTGATITSANVVPGVSETLVGNVGNNSESVNINTGASASVVSGSTVNATGINKSGLVFTCYYQGTKILTESGEVAIEAIRAGDMVVVRRDGQDALEPVVWFGRSKIDLTRHAQPELAAPIRIRTSALAQDIPARDLLLSPEHCLIISGRCVPVKLLVNGGSIAREYPAAPFEYFHLELARHGILIADGAEAESYLDTGNRSLFDNAGAPPMLHPAFEVNATSDRWHTDACLPLASMEDEVALIWQTLADRSAALGLTVPVPATVEDPDLHLLADGQRIQPVSDHDLRYVFTVPAGVKSVSLVSRYCIPADKMISSQRDTRRLGVSVNWIAIRSDDHEMFYSADHPALRDGWNDAEQAGASIWRWTSGAATIPWGDAIGSVTVTIRCTPVHQYPVYEENLLLVA